MIDQSGREIKITTTEGQQELDRIIAERLGWTSLAFIPECYGVPPNEQCKRRVASYCTDLDEAIQLEHKDYRLDLQQSFHFTETKMWLARYEHMSTFIKGSAYNTSPAMAVCLAWLAAWEKK